MKDPSAFQTRRLVGRAPTAADEEVYRAVFGRIGARELQRNIHDFQRHHVAPWTLQLNGADVGVGGFRLGFGVHEGLELTLSLASGRVPVGLAGEFLADALLFVQGTFRADRIFCLADRETDLSPRMLENAGFEDAGAVPDPGRPDRRLMRWRSASPPAE